MTAPSPVHDKDRRNALKAYREGRVTITSVTYPNPSALRAKAVSARVRGFTETHAITFVEGLGQWVCSCGAGHCSHVLAVQLCTGHAGWNTTDQQPPAGPPPADLPSERGWTRAAFPGKCAYCGQPYAAKDPIRAVKKADQQVGTVWAGSCCKEALNP